MFVIRRHVMVFLILAAGARAAVAEDLLARNANEWCAAHPGEVLVREGAGAWRRIADDRVREDDEGRLTEAWRGDLDGDGRADLVLRHTSGCGTRECPHEAFVSCRDGTFSATMEPEYADKVRVVKPTKRGWARIEIRTVGEARAPARRYLWTVLRLSAAGYK